VAPAWHGRNTFQRPRRAHDVHPGGGNWCVALPGFLDAAEVAELRDEFARFREAVLPRLPREEVFYEKLGDESTLKQVQRLHEHDAFFGRMMTAGKFRRVAEIVLGESVTCRNMQYFNKPPGVGQPTPPHQDGYYFMLEPCAAVTMWLALEDVDEETGCVRYVTGSHRLGMRVHSRTGTLGFSQGIPDYPCPNDRVRTRRALGFIYYADSARTDEQAHAAYKARLAAGATGRQPQMAHPPGKHGSPSLYGGWGGVSAQRGQGGTCARRAFIHHRGR